MLVDLVDQQNRPVGIAPRADLFVQKRGFRTVHVIIMGAGGDVLLQQLPGDHPRSPGKLGSSAAGYVKAGETYRHAAQRKLVAELSLRSSVVRVGDFVMLDDGCRKFVEVFRGETTGMPRFDKEEIAGLVWMSPAAVRQRVLGSPQDFTLTFLDVYAHFHRQLF